MSSNLWMTLNDMELVNSSSSVAVLSLQWHRNILTTLIRSVVQKKTSKSKEVIKNIHAFST